MKILHVRFCNLNSLGGSWFIDLTTPEYSSDGIFAITGPTGAGKTTILDAVCLALYGRTPRLKQVSKSTNEIMTRQTGECWAEVEFSTTKGRYRCHWSQHRARRTAGGELQPPRHEIVDCRREKPLETKMKLVAQKVIDLTGMTYDQFTRSILLAQGDFNTFLKASPDERAPILEQITGTEVYSRISKKVHERKGEELLLFEQLTRDCNGFTPLSPEQLTEITTRLEALARQAGDAEKRIAHYHTLLDWYTTQDKLQREINLRTQQLAALSRRWEMMEPQRQQLARADRAKLLEPAYSRLVEQRTLQEKETDERASSALLLSQLAKDIQNTTDQKSQAKEHLMSHKAEAKQQEGILRKVRGLDQQANILHDQKTELENELRNELQRKAELEQSGIEIAQKIQKTEAELKHLRSYREEHGQDRKLVEEFSGIRQQLGHYTELSKKHSAAAAEIPLLKKRLAHSERQVTEKKLQTESLTARQRKREQDEAAAKELLAELLNGRSSEQLYNRTSRVQEKLYQLERTTSAAEQLVTTTAELKALDTQENVIIDELKSLQDRSQRAAEECVRRKDSVEKQRRIVQLATRITNYEQERKFLHDGEPCPLCGSLTHPYSSADGPAVAVEQTQLETEIALLEIARERRGNVQEAQAATKMKQEQLIRSRSEKEQQRHQTSTALSALCETLGLQPNEHLLERLAQRRADLVLEQEKLRSTRTQVERLKAQIEEAGHARTRLNRDAAAAERELLKLLHEQEKLYDQLQQQQTARLQLENQLTEKQHYLEQLLAPFHDRRFTLADPDLQERLEQRRTLWLQSEEQHQAFASQLQQHRAEQASQQLLLARQQKICSEKQSSLSRLTMTLTSLAEQRRHIFGEDNPDTVEQQMLTRLEKAEQKVTELRNKLGELQQQHAALSERVAALEQRITERARKLQELGKAFITAFTEAGFQDEKHFLDSRMGSLLYSELSESVHQQQKAMEETKAVLNSSKVSLLDEQRRKLTNAAPADITTLLAEQRDLHIALQQETGGLSQQLRDNQRQQERHAEKLEQLTAQKQELERWSRLHELIGSNDGKKFRNFAQGLTFEIMISHANTSLRKMSDRYLLVRDPAQPLELHVIDNYQGGEIRSTKNLSGGESFIVSMALALGLSSMASNNVQVDSLFLDEGFGTLDEESLQTALDTLSSLHQEGKLIGIISHVSGLQERITSQIRVTRGLGGLSTLSGPGTGRWTGITNA